ncbi:ester cyclase [Actinomycetota bacterium]
MEPIEIARVLFEEGWNEQNFTQVSGLLAEEVPLHIGAATHSTSAIDLQRIIAQWHTAFPDLRFDIHSVTADESIAAVRATLRGTHLGPWGDRGATGRSIAVEHSFFLRIEKGLIVEVWELLDHPTLTKQLEGN